VCVKNGIRSGGSSGATTTLDDIIELCKRLPENVCGPLPGGPVPQTPRGSLRSGLRVGGMSEE
jgi:hypothetical protein